MKIAIVCSYYPWPPSMGGVETEVQEVSTELAKRGHEVYVITTPLDVTTLNIVSNFGSEYINGVTVHKLRSLRLGIGHARLFRGLKRVIHEIKPEVVHSHCLHPHLFQLAKWKRKTNFKFIAELHHPAISLDSLSAKFAMPLVTYLFSFISKNVDCFIAHTNIECEWLRKKGVHKDNITIMKFPAIRSDLLKEVPLQSKDNSAQRILFLGRVTQIKGVHILLKALAYLKRKYSNVRLIVAGPSDAKYKLRLENIVRKLSIVDFVEFLGPVYGKEKIKLIKNSEILVLPSFREYTPTVLLEAQALGVPVVATKVGAISEMIVEGKTGLLVEPGNEYQLAEAIETLLRDKKLRRSFSIEAKRFARNFTIKNIVDELERKLYSLLRRSNWGNSINLPN
ncbi:MAG: glycosyltransferase family 4 protein [Candidatus Baldrarchaeia archaeon]